MNNFYSSDLPVFFCRPKNYHFKSKLHSDYPINSAAFFGDIQRVKELINLGVDLNVQGDLGYTPLHHAVYQGHLEIVKILVKAGANIKLKTELGKSIFDLAKATNHDDISRWIISFSAVDTNLNLEDILNYYSRRYYYGERINLESVNESGESPLHIAVKRERLKEVSTLILAGANLDSFTDDGFEFTPLHYAVGKQNLSILKLLLNSGADFSLKSGMGYSIMDLAMIIGNNKIIFYLYSFMDKNNT